MKKIIFISFIASMLALGALAQPPGGPPMRPEGGRPPRDAEPRGEMRPTGDWIKMHDANTNGILETDEFQAAMERTFAELDRNKNGTIDPGEAVRPPRPMGPPPTQERREPEMKKLLPPFFFLDRVEPGGTFTRQDFDRIVRSVFTEMDKDRDGRLTPDEARMLPGRPGNPGPPQNPPGPPNARFIGAELRFGDRLVKGQPFSAEIVIEDTRRLFDGSTVTHSSRGAIYRDGEGRTRREQPLEMVGGVNIVGAGNKPQKLIFINDFASQTHIFLDVESKIARRMPLGPPPVEPREKADAKQESLGTKSIEGVAVEGTRVTFEIPAGQIGNGKPMPVVTERWFSKDLQVLVMSRHVDPIAGEHIFKLVNIKRAEPGAALFSIPTDYRVEGQGARRNED